MTRVVIKEPEIDVILMGIAEALRKLAIRELERTLGTISNPLDPGEPNPIEGLRSSLSTHIKRLEEILKILEHVEGMVKSVREVVREDY